MTETSGNKQHFHAQERRTKVIGLVMLSIGIFSQNLKDIKKRPQNKKLGFKVLTLLINIHPYDDVNTDHEHYSIPIHIIAHE